MPQPRFIDHKGTRILYLDCARASPLEHARGMRAAAAVIAPEPPGSVLLLVDVTGAAENAQTHEVIREFVEETGPRLRARAVVGLAGLRRVFFERARRELPGEHAAFDDLEVARDWLAAHG